jgi:hypothetical protein
VFRRTIDGQPYTFNVAGIWGSGNVVTERALWLVGENTTYAVWDGRALTGPGRAADAHLERFPALVSVLPLATFLERYGSLGPSCAVWLGEEVRGEGCPEACAALDAVCPVVELEVCESRCADFPRPLVECMTAAQGCAAESLCGLAAWEEARASGEIP